MTRRCLRQAVEKEAEAPRMSIFPLAANLAGARSPDARRARTLGFTADTDMTEIVRAHLEDELGGVVR